MKFTFYLLIYIYIFIYIYIYIYIYWRNISLLKAYVFQKNFTA